MEAIQIETNKGNDKEVDIVSFAAIADIKERDNPEQTVEFNVMGTIFILEACKEFNIERFIYSSSIYVYTEHGSFYKFKTIM